MNGTLILGSRDATNIRVESSLGENVAILFGKDYFN
jgi:hypothetical protein